MKSIWHALSRPSLGVLDVVAVAAIIGLLAGLLIPQSDHDRTHRYPPARVGTGTALADIAGTYHQRAAPTSGWELSILPDGRYSRFCGSCTGTGDRESGYVRLLAGHCILLPTGPSDASPRVERDFFPVRWQERRYLIPADRMQEYCYAITEAKEPRPETTKSEQFLVRSPAPPVDGIPELPEPWDAYLRENLVIGKVVEAMGGNRLRIDLGSADGIEIADVLAVQRRDEARVRYVVAGSVQDRSSVAVELYRDDHNEPLEAGRSVVMQRDIRRRESPRRRSDDLRTRLLDSGRSQRMALIFPSTLQPFWDRSHVLDLAADSGSSGRG
jgi:hypothetical protein